MTSHELDRAIDALARKQHGAFSHSQAQRRGATDRIIRHRRDTHQWLVLDDLVYALLGNPPTWLRQAKAAELSVPGSALSGRSAAALHRFDGFPRAGIEISAPRGTRRSSRLAVVRHRFDIPTTSIAGIRVTTIEQTVLDLAACVPPLRVEAAMDDLLVGRRMTLDAMGDAWERASRGRLSGARLLGSLLDECSPDAYVPPTNVLERALYRVLDDPRLPAYDRQAHLPPWPGTARCADALVGSWRRLVEADGRRWHTRCADFERDRERPSRANEWVRGHSLLVPTAGSASGVRDQRAARHRRTSSCMNIGMGSTNEARALRTLAPHGSDRAGASPTGKPRHPHVVPREIPGKSPVNSPYDPQVKWGRVNVS